MTTQITIAYGDGIGYEILDAALLVMREAGAALDVEVVQMGEEEYRLGAPNGFDNRTLRAIQRTGVLLKAPTINPALIEKIAEEMAQETFYPVSDALYAALDLPTQERSFIHADKPEFTAISSISDQVAVFETALEFDSAPHPAAMIFAATQMLHHIGQTEIADNISFALLKTLQAETALEKFTDTVIESL